MVRCGWLLMCWILATPTWAFNTLEVTESATSPDCVDYCVTGVCFWLVCNLVLCKIKTSVKVKHRNPEVVISVYPQPGDNPWTEMKTLYAKFTQKLQETAMDLDPGIADVPPGSGKQVAPGGKSTGLRFYEAQAIGHPLAQIGKDKDLMCPSAATPFLMHFSSEVDANAWRSGTLEKLYFPEILPGFREVGEHSPLQKWGGVYPRTGFITQYEPAKAAAMIAQRVANILSQDKQPHLYIPLTDNHYQRTWQPGEVTENDLANHAFQMLHPKKMKQCEVFGENDTLSLKGWSHDRRSDENQYAFTLWRPYECCKQKGKWIGDATTEGICL